MSSANSQKMLIILWAMLCCIKGLPLNAPAAEIAAPPTLSDEEKRLLENQVKTNLTTGDLRLTVKQARQMRQRSAVIGVAHWPNGEVIYQFDPALNSEQKKMIETAFAEYKKYTCIQFLPYVPGKHKNYIKFINEEGCWSQFGMTGGVQELSLGEGCYYEAVTAMHEIAHALGFMHEQSRPDRDRWVKIHFENVSPSMSYNFDRFNVADLLQLPYDYKSTMHYDRYSFSTNRKTTIETLHPQFKDVIGQNVGFSYCDIAKINTLYNCDPGSYLRDCDLGNNELIPYGKPKIF